MYLVGVVVRTAVLICGTLTPITRPAWNAAARLLCKPVLSHSIPLALLTACLRRVRRRKLAPAAYHIGYYHPPDCLGYGSNTRL